MPSIDDVSIEKQAATTPTSLLVLITDQDIQKVKIDQLRAELTKRGINKNGLEKDLVEKLVREIADKVPCVSVETTCAPTTS